MKITKKILIFTAVVGLISLIFLLVWLNARSRSQPIPLLPLVREEEAVPVDSSRAEAPLLKGVQIALLDQTQRLNWQLQVEQVVEADGIFLLSDITGEYYTLSGEKYLVEASKGEMGTDFSWLRLAPEVVFSGAEIQLRADELSWAAEAGEEITGRKLRVDGEKVTIYAEQFSFNPEKGGIILPGESQWSFQ